jgi:hypothetical protein
MVQALTRINLFNFHNSPVLQRVKLKLGEVRYLAKSHIIIKCLPKNLSLFFLRQDLLSTDWLRTLNPPASASQVLKLQVYVTMPGRIWDL